MRVAQVSRYSVKVVAWVATKVASCTDTFSRSNSTCAAFFVGKPRRFACRRSRTGGRSGWAHIGQRASSEQLTKRDGDKRGSVRGHRARMTTNHHVSASASDSAAKGAGGSCAGCRRLPAALRTAGLSTVLRFL